MFFYAFKRTFAILSAFTNWHRSSSNFSTDGGKTMFILSSTPWIFFNGLGFRKLSPSRSKQLELILISKTGCKCSSFCVQQNSDVYECWINHGCQKLTYLYIICIFFAFLYIILMMQNQIRLFYCFVTTKMVLTKCSILKLTNWGNFILMHLSLSIRENTGCNLMLRWPVFIQKLDNWKSLNGCIE